MSGFLYVRGQDPFYGLFPGIVPAILFIGGPVFHIFLLVHIPIGLTIVDLKELEYEAERGYADTEGLAGYFEDIEEPADTHHLVFFDFSNSDEFEKILHKTLRDNDIIMQRGNCFYIRLSGLSEEGKRAVVGRIMKNLEKEGLYSRFDVADKSVL